MNHYDYLDEHLPAFFEAVGVAWEGNGGIIVAHGDKCSSYKDGWEEAGIPFPHGAAIYLLSYCHPYSLEVRDTPDGEWVPPKDWVKANYDRFKAHLPQVS